MTLREWVRTSRIGTPAEREEFETGMLECYARMIDRGERCHTEAPLERSAPAIVWQLSFLYVRLRLKRAGVPLGQPPQNKQEACEKEQ